MTGFDVPTAVHHATWGRSARNYMENPPPKTGGRKESENRDKMEILQEKEGKLLMDKVKNLSN